MQKRYLASIYRLIDFGLGNLPHRERSSEAYYVAVIPIGEEDRNKIGGIWIQAGSLEEAGRLGTEKCPRGYRIVSIGPPDSRPK